MGLIGDCLATISILDDAKRNEGHHDDANNAGGEEDWPLQILDLLRVWTGRFPGVLRGVGCASGEHGRRRHSCHRRRYFEAARTHILKTRSRAFRITDGAKVNLLVTHGTITSIRSSSPATTNA